MSATVSCNAECARLQAKYPGQVPIVVEVRREEPRFIALPRDATIANLEASLAVLLNTAKRMTLCISACTPAVSTTLGDVADACKNADGFLYVKAAVERVMGATNVDLSNVPCGNPDNYTYS